MMTYLKQNNGFISLPIIVGLIMVGLLISGLTLFRLNNKSKAPNTMQLSEIKHNSIEMPIHTASGAANPLELEIQITKDGFIPSSITINKGQQITWSNLDKIAHNVSTNNNQPAMPNTDPIEPGQSFSYVFDSPGEYEYSDNKQPAPQIIIFTGIILEIIS